MSKKRLSADEKRGKLMELFFEKKEFFQLKELEKIAPKEKGIVAQTVKDVLQSLVDDNLVETDKIGTSIYFWAFPSKALNEKNNKLNMMKKSLQDKKIKLQDYKSKLEEAKLGRSEDADRFEKLQELAELNKRLANVKQELSKYAHMDPEVIQKYQTDIEETKDAVNRWTDNIFAAKGWCKKKMGCDDKIFNAQFGIPHDLDYMEE